MIPNNLQAIIDEVASHLHIMHGSAHGFQNTSEERTNATIWQSAKAFCIAITTNVRHS
jgi:dTDP-4-dehydrorhamnose 3,5-epimerase-like enzyme